MEAFQIKDKLQTSLLDIGDYLEIGWLQFTKNIRTFLIYSLLINLPVVLIDLLFPLSVNPETGEFEGNIGLAIFLRLISFVLGMLLSIAVYKIIERSVNGQNLEPMTAFKNSFPLILMMIVVSLITSILVFLGFVLVIIPGIWLSVSLSFVVQAVALRNCNLNAINYSRSLVKNRWWALFGRFILLAFCSLLLFLPLILILGFITGIGTYLGVGFITQIFASLVYGLLAYYLITVNTIIFLNFDYTKASQRLT